MDRTLSENEPLIINNEEEPPHPAAASARRQKAIAVNMSTVEEEAIDWIWPDRIALGMFTILLGDPELGKSWFSLYLATMLSTGGTFPDGIIAPTLNTVVMSCEDGVANTVKPRLRTLGADQSRIWHFSEVEEKGRRRLPTLTDLVAIEELLATHRPGLFVVDPVNAYLGAKCDSYRDSDVRALLAPVAVLLDKYRCAGLAVMHPKKGAAPKAIQRINGSIAFGALCRLALLVTKDESEDAPEDQTLILGAKNNVGARAKGLAFTLRDGQLLFSHEPVDAKADDVGKAQPKPKPPSPAEELLLALLAKSPDGRVKAHEAIEAGEAAGISESTLRRAMGKLGLRSRRLGFGLEVVWERPAQEI